MPAPIRIVVVDDQELVRAGLIALLSGDTETEVVGEATNGEEALRLLSHTHAHVVLMDVRMPVLDGIESTRRIKLDSNLAEVRVIMLTTFDLDEFVFGALRAGADGFLLKDTPPADLRRAIRAAVSGDALLAPSITRRLIGAFASSPPQPVSPDVSSLDLTPRETDILTLIAHGLTNSEIAGRLHIGGATVKTYVSRLLDKLDVTTRVHLVIRAYEAGLVTPTPRSS